ncbi:MAG: CpsD/CapB family tyrosine-protein kinase [Gemmiger sp.]|uniref:polysaccharide biosynthesis tyrosine autokinase n=1 Tax=Gemmiger sp. TaxID=2049027 RepID=UPI002E780DA0|nr:CpsD/CapB family tyrosine-protein kinase [Gemmiger sp.]MEE0801574.1 CpsD/CapB family tyrosine-protein kinase [Gemmiger sp.]
MNNSETSAWSALEPWCVLTRVLRSAWMILLAALIGVAAAATLARTQFRDRYGARVTLVVMSRSSTSASQDASTANSVASTFSELLGSDFMRRQILEGAGLDSFSGTLTAANTADTNLITVTVTADTAREAFLVIRSITKNYNQLTQYLFRGAVISVLNAPINYTISTLPMSLRRMELLAALACAAVVVLVIVLEMLRDDTVQTTQAARDKLDARLLLSIAHEKNRSGKRRRPLLLTEPTVSFTFSESVHRLRARLEQEKASEGTNIFLFTSVMEHEGKSTLAENVALSLAQKHRSVLLVDADFRKRSRFCDKAKDWKVQQYDYNDFKLCCAHVKSSNLYVLYSPTLLKDPSRLLVSGRFSRLLAQLKSSFGYLVVDTPPLELFSDAEMLSDLDAASVLVVRQDLVPAPVINDAIDTLKQRRARFLGCVLNDVRVLMPSVLAPYGSDYGYGYGKYGKYGKYGGYAKYEQAAEQDKGGEA